VCEVLAPGRADLDLRDPAVVLAALRERRPSAVINAAAHTAVDAAEDGGEGEAAAFSINVEGARNLAAACAAESIPLLHVSTDYVSGAVAGEIAEPGFAPALAATPPEEFDLSGLPAGTAGVYARSKWEGEKAVRTAHPGAAIVRTAWVYTGPARGALGLAGSDFVATMLRLEAERETVDVVSDQWGSPTFAGDLADGLLAAALRLADGDGALEGAVFNAAGAGRATWFDVAAEVFALAGADRERVRPVGTEDFPRPAPRPPFSVLSGDEWRRAGLPALPGWRDAMRRAFLAAR